PRPPAAARQIGPAHPARPRADRRHPDAVRTRGLRGSVDSAARLRAREPDGRARDEDGGPGDANARDDPPRLRARLLADGAGRSRGAALAIPEADEDRRRRGGTRGGACARAAGTRTDASARTPAGDRREQPALLR